MFGEVIGAMFEAVASAWWYTFHDDDSFCTRENLPGFLVVFSFMCAITFVGPFLALTFRATRIDTNDAGPLGATARWHASTPAWVDAVYLWVNGSQSEVQRSLLSAETRGLLPYRPHSSRFRDDGLLQYALRSLLTAERLVSSVRHVYLLTSGEIPSWLPADLRALDGSPRGASPRFTEEMVWTPLAPLLERARPVNRELAAALAAAGGDERKLFIVPHSSSFPEPAAELPTFNSNAVLSTIHRIPGLSEWFLYSDDDVMITQRNITLAAWWDQRTAAQKLYLVSGAGVHRTRAASGNLWEQAMTYMSGLLDEVAPPTTQQQEQQEQQEQRRRRRPHHPPPPPPTPHTRAVGSRQTAGPVARMYARPQHMPVLMSRTLVSEMESLWPVAFNRTRRARLRAPDEIELNFLYAHYLRAMRFPTELVASSRARFMYAQECAPVMLSERLGGRRTSPCDTILSSKRCSRLPRLSRAPRAMRLAHAPITRSTALATARPTGVCSRARVGSQVRLRGLQRRRDVRKNARGGRCAPASIAARAVWQLRERSPARRCAIEYLISVICMHHCMCSRIVH